MGWQIELDLLPGKQVTRTFRSGTPGTPGFREVTYGTYGVFGWFACRVGGRWSAAWTVHDERAACELLEKWMRSREGAGRVWTEVPLAAADNAPVSY